MNNSAINTDTVITNIKKNLFELRELEVAELSTKDKEEFKVELSDLENIAKEILEKIIDHPNPDEFKKDLEN